MHDVSICKAHAQCASPCWTGLHMQHCISALPSHCTDCVQELLPFTRDVLGRPLIMLAKNPTVRQSAHHLCMLRQCSCNSKSCMWV